MKPEDIKTLEDIEEVLDGLNLRPRQEAGRCTTKILQIYCKLLMAITTGSHRS